MKILSIFHRAYKAITRKSAPIHTPSTKPKGTGSKIAPSTNKSHENVQPSSPPITPTSRSLPPHPPTTTPIQSVSSALEQKIKQLISKLKTDGTPEEHANNISQKLLNSLNDGKLNLSYLQISDEILNQILPLLSVLNVTSLDLSGNNIGPAGATSLAKTLETNTSIKELYLAINQIGDEGAIAIADALNFNTSLTHLNIRNNNIGPKGAIAIADALNFNTSLTHLNIGENDIGPYTGAKAIADALKTNISLKHLNLRNTKIRLKGAQKIAKSLKTNRSLKHLNLKGNDIRTGAIALAEALKINTSLTHLDLEGNNIGTGEAKALLEALKTTTSIIELNFEYKIEDDLKKAIEEELKINKENEDLKNIICLISIQSQENFLSSQVMSFIFSKNLAKKLETISERKQQQAAQHIWPKNYTNREKQHRNWRSQRTI